MPHPIKKKLPRDAFILFGSGGEDKLRQVPELAALAMCAIASWSSVEYVLLKTYVALLGGPEEKAATAYLALETQNAKSAAILAVSRRFLDADMNRLLHAILGVLKTNQKQRDKLAHHLWGWDARFPRSLLLADPREIVTGPNLREQVFLYDEGDLEAIIRANKRLVHFILSYNFILTNHPANKDGSLSARLCAEPEIRERLDRQA